MKGTRYNMLLLIASLVVVVDQVTKWLIVQNFRMHEALPVIPNFFDLVYVRNKGAAFGILADTGFRVPFLLTTTMVAVVFLVWFYRQLKPEQVLSRSALSMVLGGAVGNLIDRLRLGEVIDFLDVHWFQHHWPAFNVADSAICVGVGMLLLAQWRDSRQSKG
ncbi:MAG: signal peptidase II [Pedobacter sp.]